ncbi:methyltransferase [uncultured Brevundimonas sp.]|uniref:class I SAM-dependent methyltransferase n=1 Tax=uncultured Brevundimonas sp. TaxID=213418 RepID=UPI0025DACED7|nr:methyltransferase [uncultured Brevundimonas sp.]
MTTTLLYGRPPAVFDPPGSATQVSPLIPGSASLEDVEPGSVDDIMIYAPPGVLERRYTLALALRALKPGGRLDVMAPKDKGGSRLKKELEALGVTVGETAKAHHRRCVVTSPETATGLDAAIAAGAMRLVPWDEQSEPGEGFWSQPGMFSWDRVDAGTNRLGEYFAENGGVDLGFKGAGADLGCGWGALTDAVLMSDSRVSSMRLIDVDRRAIRAAKQYIGDREAHFAGTAQISYQWADVRLLDENADLDFIVTNPPFHDGGAEDKRLGQAFIRKTSGMLKKGGVLWCVANRHLPYEAELNAAFKRVRMVADSGGYKLFEAVK